MVDAPKTTTLRDVYIAVLRHKKKAILFFLTVMAIVTLATVLLPKTYRSEAKLFVRLGRENATLDPTAMLGEDTVVAIPPSRENEINSVAEMLKARLLVEEVVDTIGPEAILGSDGRSPTGDRRLAGPLEHPPKQPRTRRDSSRVGWGRWLRDQLLTPLSDRDRAVRKVSKRLDVTPVRKSDLIQVSYEARSPKLAQSVVAKLCDSYLEQHVRLNRTAGAHDFLARETEHLRQKLARAEEELRDLKNEAGLASREGRRRIVVERIGRLEDQLLANSALMAASEAKVQRLREALAGLPETQVTEKTTGFANFGTDGMREQFYALKLKEQELASRLTESHPVLQEIRRQAEAAKEVLDREEPTRTQVTTGPAKTFEEIHLALFREEPVLSSLRAEADSLQQQLVGARDELRTLNENELRIANLEREIRLHEANYLKYSANLEQARIDEAMENQRISNINVVQPATYDAKPVRPNKLKNLILGLLVGIFGGLAVALVADYLDRSFRTPEDVEARLGLPTLASIPRFTDEQLALDARN